jgi:hypothetical protein
MLSAYPRQDCPEPGSGSIQRAEVAPFGHGATGRTIGSQTPRLRIEGHRDLELEGAASARRPYVDATQRPPAGAFARAKPFWYAFHPVDDALADDGSGDFPKTHAIRL